MTTRRRKQDRRLELLTPEQKRERQVRKAMEADRASWLLIGGTVAWEREQNRRRAARNQRTRERTAAVLAAKRESTLQPALWEDAA